MNATVDRRRFLAGTALSPWLLSHSLNNAHASETRRPNVILIVADDLGYSELGCYGQQKIETPHLDRLAREGMRFTQFYSGQAVCAPSRCVLMSGQHTGHAFIRDNYEVRPEGQLPIPKSSYTMADMFKAQGYATAAIGKWGLGPVHSCGDPNEQGFDLFFGYNCQRHAHNYYPRYLYRNQERIELPGNDRGLTGEQYAPDLMIEEAKHFIRENEHNPFFLYYPTPIPHLALQVPEDSIEPYLGQWDDPPYDGTSGYLPHENPRSAYGGMITRMDQHIGEMLQTLDDCDLTDDTLVIFTSDNGATFLRGPDTRFFESNGPLRNWKGSLYEGGIRVPLIARWPGRIPAGTTSNHICAFWDLFATLAEAAGGQAPEQHDGISIMPALQNEPDQPQHDYLYWEFPSYRGQQAIRMGRWKGIRTNLFRQDADHSLQLYDLETDIGEQNNLAEHHPEIVQTMLETMRNARVPSDHFPFDFLDQEMSDA